MQALERLQESDGSCKVEAVAQGCGYRSMDLFSADFKRHFDVSPSWVRRSAL
jgi:AraC-like DNA-binding protein